MDICQEDDYQVRVTLGIQLFAGEKIVNGHQGTGLDLPVCGEDGRDLHGTNIFAPLRKLKECLDSCNINIVHC